MKITVLSSISGGRTSAYMSYLIKNNQERIAEHLGADELDIHYVFANTGMEHDDTLRFMQAVDENFGLGVVWVESEAQHGVRKSSKHRVVTPETAFRNTQWMDERHPFHDHIIKYGIPNIAFPSCTREMKLNAITDYMKSIGHTDYYTAIGIRMDEGRRVSKQAGANKIFYPLIDIFPTDKDEVIDFFNEFDWDLKIPEWQGNCVTCFKKSFKKHNAVYVETPEAFKFNAYMEKHYPRVGPEFNKGDPTVVDRVFFRGGLSTEKLIDSFSSDNPYRYIDDGGCSESCEMYQTYLI